MRRYSFFSIVVFFFLFLTTTNAQNQIGVRAGANWNKVKASIPFVNIGNSLKGVEKFNFGLIYTANLSEKFGIQTELNYMKKGFAVTQDLGDVNLLGVEIPINTKVEAQITYVDIPILAKYKFGENALKGYAILGPYLGYASKGELVAYSDTGDEVKLASTNFNFTAVKYARFEVGGTAGIGTTLDVGVGEIFADVRYNFGLTKLFDIPLLNSTNRGVGVNLGLLINI